MLLNEKQLLPYVELLFFAYRDFVSDPDTILKEFNFGRAHHRVLHFVNQEPGLRVADLLEILKITKQSLARVLKQLIEDGYIRQETGENDKRERHLFVTEAGAQLARDLMRPQLSRIQEALKNMNECERKIVIKFLYGMIEDKNETIAAHHLQKLMKQSNNI